MLKSKSQFYYRYLYIFRWLLTNILRKGFKLYFHIHLQKILKLIKFKLFFENKYFRKFRKKVWADKNHKEWYFKLRNKTGYYSKKRVKKIDRFGSYKRYIYRKKKKQFYRKISKRILSPLYFIFLSFKKVDLRFGTTIFYKSGIKYIFPKDSKLQVRMALFFRKLYLYSAYRNETKSVSRIVYEIFDSYVRRGSTFTFFKDLWLILSDNIRLLYLTRPRRRGKIKKRFLNIFFFKYWWLTWIFQPQRLKKKKFFNKSCLKRVKKCKVKYKTFKKRYLYLKPKKHILDYKNVRLINNKQHVSKNESIFKLRKVAYLR